MASAVRFMIFVPIWSTGIGFSKLSGFNSTVETQEYSYNSFLGNNHSKQFGRTKPPSLTLERALDRAGFLQLFSWHALARQNSPAAKMIATFEIMDAGGGTMIACMLDNAWCSKLELDPAQAGGGTVVSMRATIECDAIRPT
ncbi:phage tail protein [Amycolatopsis sp. H20-H5]|uniref:phage tail protein n=1 Tax=Amycolatopsis sp. H20-H5 TaxID=3046309 RepID=UPI002DBD5708|nr:phage tail protein [Amycolatopsis sp. H20-H5]MEC3978756.1 phage tail protein [Amycolatopsis sp. H20-H5]